MPDLTTALQLSPSGTAASIAASEKSLLSLANGPNAISNPAGGGAPGSGGVLVVVLVCRLLLLSHFDVRQLRRRLLLSRRREPAAPHTPRSSAAAARSPRCGRLVSPRGARAAFWQAEDDNDRSLRSPHPALRSGCNPCSPGPGLEVRKTKLLRKNAAAASSSPLRQPAVRALRSPRAPARFALPVLSQAPDG